MSNSNFGMAAPKNPVERIIGIFTSPRETLEDVSERPNYWLPLIVLAVVALLLAVLLRDIGMEYTLEKMRNNPNITPEQLARTEEGMRQMANSPLRFLNLIFAPIGAIIAVLVVAGAFMFAGNVIMGGEANFKTIFSVTAWAGFIGVLETIVKTPLRIAQRSLEVTTSLAIILSPDAKDSFLYKLLNRFDLFTIWHLVVYTFGIAAIYKFSMGKSATIVVGLWILWTAIYLAFSQLFGGFGFGG
jgi:hypothetical protein